MDKQLKLSDARKSILEKSKGSSLQPMSNRMLVRPDTELMSLSSGYGGEGAPFLKFDTSRYQMLSPDFDLSARQYKEKFFDNLAVNKKHIHKQLVELTYLQIDEKLNDSSVTENLPKMFDENKVLWSNTIIRSKNLQNIYAEFTNRIAFTLDNEIKVNEGLTSEFLKYPHQRNIRKR